MNKADIIKFFDQRAKNWDTFQQLNKDTIQSILMYADVTEGKTVLDVACGTGIMIPYYLEKKVKQVTGVDIAPNMIGVAREKFPQDYVQFLCGDIEQMDLEQKFDCVVMYNAFPHFPDGKKLLERLSSLVKPGGTLTVAHGASRDVINSCHVEEASKVSLGLPEVEEVAELFPEDIKIVTMISDDNMYLIMGRK